MRGRCCKQAVRPASLPNQPRPRISQWPLDEQTTGWGHPGAFGRPVLDLFGHAASGHRGCGTLAPFSLVVSTATTRRGSARHKEVVAILSLHLPAPVGAVFRYMQLQHNPSDYQITSNVVRNLESHHVMIRLPCTIQASQPHTELDRGLLDTTKRRASDPMTCSFGLLVMRLKK